MVALIRRRALEDVTQKLTDREQAVVRTCTASGKYVDSRRHRGKRVCWWRMIMGSAKGTNASWHILYVLEAGDECTHEIAAEIPLALCLCTQSRGHASLEVEFSVPQSGRKAGDVAPTKGERGHLDLLMAH